MNPTQSMWVGFNFKEIKMEKCIVSTYDNKTYLTPLNESIRHSRPTVVPKSTFVEGLRDSHKLKVHAVGLPEAATDAEFFKHWIESKKDAALAIESFCAVYGVNTSGISIPIETKADIEKPLTAKEQKAKEAKEKFEKALADKEATDKEAADKEAADKEAADKEAADKEAADKEAADKEKV